VAPSQRGFDPETIEVEAMFRKELVELLHHHPATLRELAVLLDEPVKEVESDLQHLIKSLHYQPFRVIITPARCNKCNFVFHKEKLHKPSKCPRCRSQWIREPKIAIEERT